MNIDDPRGRLTASIDQMRTAAFGFGSELQTATRLMRDMDSEAGRLSRSIGSSLRTAFDQAIFRGKDLGTVLKGLVSDLGSTALDSALRPIQGAIGKGIGSIASSLTGALGFANGGAIAGGRIRPFASGGVIDKPTLFPMRGTTGLMGEAGPEAIMPLKRGPDGRLGVQTHGKGNAPIVNVTIQTQDISGFQRSRGQISAELARAVRAGSSRL